MDIKVGDYVYVSIVNLFGGKEILAEVTYVSIYGGEIRADCEDGVSRVTKWYRKAE